MIAASRHPSVGQRPSIEQPITGPDLIEREFTAPAPVRGVDLIDAAGQTAVEREPIPRLGARVILLSTAGEFWCHSRASAGGGGVAAVWIWAER